MTHPQFGAISPLASLSAKPLRAATARLLRQASRQLTHLASFLRPAATRSGDPSASALEFYAEAGAPEGALYLNGEFVGYLPGVDRL